MRRIGADEDRPSFTPRFLVPEGTKVLLFGECFGEAMALYLHRMGFAASMGGLKADLADGLTQKHNPPQIYQELLWASEVLRSGRSPEMEDCERFALRLPDGRIIDSNLTSPSPVPPERFIERRRELFQVLKEVPDLSCVVLSLSEIEGWHDDVNDQFIARGIPTADFLLHRFSYRIPNFDECLDYVQRSIELIRVLNPDCKVLLLVSPQRIPFSCSGTDSVIVNEQSKAILRTVCVELCRRHDFIDYIPFYETLIQEGPGLWSPDGRRVKENCRRRIFDRFLPRYFAAPEHRRCLCFAESALIRYQSDPLANNTAIDEALQHIRGALASSPEEAEYLRIEAACLFEKGLHDDAGQRLERALNAEPYNLNARILFARLLASVSGRMDEALKYAEQLVSSNPDSHHCREVYGEVLLRAGRLDKAAAELKNSASLSMFAASPWAKLAEVLIRLGEREEALSAARKAYQAERDGATYANRYIQLLLEDGELKSAEEVLSGVFYSKLGNAESHALQSKLFTARANHRGASEQAKAAVKLAPSCAEYRELYAGALAALDRKAEAEQQKRIGAQLRAGSALRSGC